MSQVNFFTETSTVGEDAQAGLGAGGVGARPLALASGAVATQAGLPAAAGQHLRARHPAVPLRPILQLPFLCLPQHMSPAGGAACRLALPQHGRTVHRHGALGVTGLTAGHGRALQSAMPKNWRLEFGGRGEVGDL